MEILRSIHARLENNCRMSSSVSKMNLIVWWGPEVLRRDTAGNLADGLEKLQDFLLVPVYREALHIPAGMRRVGSESQPKAACQRIVVPPPPPAGPGPRDSICLELDSGGRSRSALSAREGFTPAPTRLADNLSGWIRSTLKFPKKPWKIRNHKNPLAFMIFHGFSMETNAFSWFPKNAW